MEGNGNWRRGGGGKERAVYTGEESVSTGEGAQATQKAHKQILKRDEGGVCHSPSFPPHILSFLPPLFWRSQPRDYWLVSSLGGVKEGKDRERLRGIVLRLHSQKITVLAR